MTRHDATEAPPTFAGFMRLLRSGADCPSLFAYRNRFDPKSHEKPRINVELRGIGCFNTSCTREEPR